MLDNLLFQSICYFLLSCFLFFLAKVLKDLATAYDVTSELKKGNKAVAFSVSGYLIAAIIVVMAALMGPQIDFVEGLKQFLGYSILGIMLLNVSRVINDKVILRKFCNVKELTEDQNMGTAAVEFGSYVASGLVVAGAVHGSGGGVVTAIAFFFLAQIFLVLFSFLYDFITPFKVHDEIEKDNVAVGLSFGGALVAVGIIMFKGTVGDFVSWTHNLANFGLSVGLSVVMLPTIRFVFDKLFLFRINLNQSLSQERNVAVALIESTGLVLFAVLIYYVVDFELWF